MHFTYLILIALTLEDPIRLESSALLVHSAPVYIAHVLEMKNAGERAEQPVTHMRSTNSNHSIPDRQNQVPPYVFSCFYLDIYNNT